MVPVKTPPDQLIGEEVEIVNSTNQSELGLTGKVVDETKMTLKIDQGGKIKTVLKQHVTIKLRKTGQLIRGSTITKRPEDRIK